MALTRKVGVIAGAKYKGGGPMLAWILHRVSGLGIIILCCSACHCLISDPAVGQRVWVFQLISFINQFTSSSILSFVPFSMG